MAISPLLSLARRALLAQETALGVVGNNIANVNTPGYSRQVAELAADGPVPNGFGVITGGGVHVEAVRQIVDPLLARRLLGTGTQLGEQSALRDQLTALTGVVNDLDSPSLAASLASFFDAADALGRNPEGLAERQTLLARATALAREVNRRASGVAEVQRAADDGFVAAVGTADQALARIADLNRQITALEVQGSPANELRDQRQQALTTLAGILPVQAVEEPNGALRVAAQNGLVLVQGGDVVHPLVTRDAGTGLDGGPLHEVGIEDGAGGFVAVPAARAGGQLAGLAAARDVHAVDAAAALDRFATALRDAVNAVQTDAAARDLDGNATAGVPVFGGTGAADLAVVLTDPRQLAAARSTEPGDNANALLLADLRSQPLAALGNVSLGQSLAAEQARVGELAARTGDAAVAVTRTHDQLETQRQAVSGVNLNEELSRLLEHQRAFQAASQMIGVVDRMLDDLLGVLR
jgi:flagellar hook-associated protein 1 FlgK